MKLLVMQLSPPSHRKEKCNWIISHFIREPLGMSTLMEGAATAVAE
jgi:hypothetical protein